MMACVRDDALNLVWCNHWYARHVFGNDGMPPTALGGTLADLIPGEATAERESIQRSVIASGQGVQHFQLSRDCRFLCSIQPLDESSFGHRGLVAVVCPATSSSLPMGPEIPTLRTPAMPSGLSVLSRRELEVLYLCGRGRSAPQIAKQLFRSSKTIEHHIQSIHGKMGFHQRGDLVRFCVERGLHLFTWDDWQRLAVHLAGSSSDGRDN
jgi:DNA-binding CsgD family transcriptional regulator